MEVLYTFGATNSGYNPVTNVVNSGTGAVYGTTAYGGSGGNGTGGVIYQLNPPGVAGESWTEIVLHGAHLT